MCAPTSGLGEVHLSYLLVSRFTPQYVQTIPPASANACRLGHVVTVVAMTNVPVPQEVFVGSVPANTAPLYRR
jgi:hypothetical protein